MSIVITTPNYIELNFADIRLVQQFTQPESRKPVSLPKAPWEK